MAIIETKYLTFSYSEGTTAALDDVNIQIREGEFTAILGHNGSGKSTLAKHFNGILLPSGGKVCVGGMDTAEDSQLFDIRKTAGMVFQNPDNQIVATVVEEDVAFACENLGLPWAELRKRVDDALAAVGMTEFANHAPHLLSGGQKQRIAIAGVLAMQPRVIIMDEPTAMLDPAGRADVMETIKELNRKKGMTVVLITHHMDEAAQADRVIVMKQGQVALDGTPKEVFAQVDKMQELSLTVPQTVEILHGLNQGGETLALDKLTVEECADELMRYLGGGKDA
ncbi:MAG: energy-coupling factor transporter ATPase [Clostridia bacterium]|nr:energy-coupling factor transporter ATPase [Clostridia bacterium]